MQDLAAVALDGGGPLVLVRAVHLRGFGSRRPDQAALFDGGGPVHGTLLGGVADATIGAVAARQPTCETVHVEIADDPAVGAGLACGGSADVVVQNLGLIPRGWWQALLDREPVALVTTLETGRSRVVTLGGPGPEAAEDRLRRGRVGAEVDGGELIEVWWPTPRMLVLGSADLAAALKRQGELLGWDVELDPGRPGSEGAAASLGAADALVVLSHDHDLATPSLAAALAGRAGYVGALGSRSTQAERRTRLAQAGVDLDGIERLRGPVGLDLGARSPEEQALAIYAEVVAVRSGRSAGALRESQGPING